MPICILTWLEGALPSRNQLEGLRQQDPDLASEAINDHLSPGLGLEIAVKGEDLEIR